MKYKNNEDKLLKLETQYTQLEFNIFKNFFLFLKLEGDDGKKNECWT
jgi:hypothetical protein